MSCPNHDGHERNGALYYPPPPLPDFDYESDVDVDLRDLLVFQETFTAQPARHRACPRMTPASLISGFGCVISSVGV